MVDKLTIKGFNKIGMGRRTTITETDTEYLILRGCTHTNSTILIQHTIYREKTPYNGNFGYVMKSTMKENDRWICRKVINRIITIKELRNLERMKGTIMDTENEIKKWVI